MRALQDEEKENAISRSILSNVNTLPAVVNQLAIFKAAIVIAAIAKAAIAKAAIAKAALPEA